MYLPHFFRFLISQAIKKRTFLQEDTTNCGILSKCSEWCKPDGWYINQSTMHMVLVLQLRLAVSPHKQFHHVPQFHCPVKRAAEQLMCTSPECQTLQWRSKYSYYMNSFQHVCINGGKGGGRVGLLNRILF